MKDKFKIILLFILFFFVSFPFFLYGIDEGVGNSGKTEADLPDVNDMKNTEENKNKPLIKYRKSIPARPPVTVVGMPGNRIGFATRGESDKELSDVVLAALIPNHTGLTTMDQPSLFWYLSQPTNIKIIFTFNDLRYEDPLVETTLDMQGKYGIQSISLSDYGIKLERDVEYEWFVSLVPDMNNRSRSIDVGGPVKRVRLTKEMEKSLSNNNMEAPMIYAEKGIWYDAFSSLSEQIEKNPDSTDLYRIRENLLTGIGFFKECAKVKNRPCDIR